MNMPSLSPASLAHASTFCLSPSGRRKATKTICSTTERYHGINSCKQFSCILCYTGFYSVQHMSNRVTKRQRENAGETVKLVAVKLPLTLVADLDHAVALTDSDRSKFTRNALRDRIAKVKSGGAR